MPQTGLSAAPVGSQEPASLAPPLVATLTGEAPARLRAASGGSHAFKRPCIPLPHPQQHLQDWMPKLLALITDA